MSAAHSLYPDIEPYDQSELTVSDVHTLYYEQCGNPAGKPVVFLHGGPGGGCNARSRRFFDPSIYRIVLFDQRGCGRSRPHASLEANTTWDLVDDIERLRTHLGIDRWQVFGGSWGSTLALTYAQAFPARVSELVLRGIFMLRHQEIAWFYQSGASNLFPDAWETYVAAIPPEERDDMVAAYYRRLTDPDGNVQRAAARAWSVWEASTSFLHANPNARAAFSNDEFALAFARIECHYFIHRGFFERDDELLRGVDRIRHIPAVIVHGRYDVVCPLRNAWDLHRAWPEADLRIVPDAGHSAFEAGNRDELLAATDRFGAR
ncbi:prolyl aminopeptidase [Spectribacter hydrogenoxidans]|uniref:Proline iminopeptidase n=1 Tax=Spectribacter hydrogenoxidans TaxID=3075608 RepID=A0ABU3C1Y8_9GAMM|nr:prolyl aminopeptidase [Salinisphaera sp. W335]MDT0635568.1 prolyl aminopeptidase [Salinisphaera sp. W335]